MSARIYQNSVLGQLGLILLILAAVAGLSSCSGSSSGGDGGATTWSLAGTVSGDVAQNVTINLTGDATGSAVTDVNGNYSITGLPAGSYTITPTRTDYTFSPVSTPITLAASDSTGNNFTATTAKLDLDRFTVSGTVSYAGVQTGTVYILLEYQGDHMSNYGTSVDAAGAYTIRGVPPAAYRAIALMDSVDNGSNNATEPVGFSADFSVTASNVLNVDITLSDPPTPTPQAPSMVLPFPGDGAAFVFWEAPRNIDDFEIAESYDLYWGTSASIGPGSPDNLGSVTAVPSSGDDIDHYIVTGLTNGNTLYFGARANVTGMASSGVTVSAPTIIGAPSGGQTVSGQVTFPAAYNGNPLLVGLQNFTGSVPEFYIRFVSSATTPQTFSISGVPNGEYSLVGVLDQNSSNQKDDGDLFINTEEQLNPVVVAGGDVVRNLTMNDNTLDIKVRTRHTWWNMTDESYMVRPLIRSGSKRAVRVAITGGPGINTVIDINPHEGEGEFKMEFFDIPYPIAGDQYEFEVTYADATSETLNGNVTGVIDSLPTNLMPTVTGSTHPTFSWTAPVAPPSIYVYDINVYAAAPMDTAWDSIPFAAGTTSVEYNFDGEASYDPLASGTLYWWHLNMTDPDSNDVKVTTSFTP